MTKGENAVVKDFNPSGLDIVDDIKSKAAELIDLIDSVNRDERCAAIAKTNIEQGAMWAVKAMTWSVNND